MVAPPKDRREGDFGAAKRSSGWRIFGLWRVSLSEATAFLVEVPTDGVLARLISTVKEGVVLWRTQITRKVVVVAVSAEAVPLRDPRAVSPLPTLGIIKDFKQIKTTAM